MSDIHLSVSIPKKSNSPSSAAAIAAAAAKKRMAQPPATATLRTTNYYHHPQQAHDVDAVFQVDSPRAKPFGMRFRPWWEYVFAGVCIVWLIVLTALHVFGGGGGGGGSAAASGPSFAPPPAGASAPAGGGGGGASPIIPVIEKNGGNSDYMKFTHPFTLQPDANTNEKIQTLTNLDILFDQVILYDVCCMHQVYFVCRTSNVKNIGVDAYLTSNKSAMVMIIHPDMVGARCVLMWTQRA